MNSHDDEDRNALSYAAEYGDKDTIKILLAAGADPKDLINGGLAIAELYASMKGFGDIVELLQADVNQ